MGLSSYNTINSIKKQGAGFTIVELLIVIVVIAILAAIVTVAYNGVTTQAVESSMKSDLQNAVTALELEHTASGSYPASPAALNDGQGLRASGDSILTYSGSGEKFCVSISNSRTATQLRIRSDDRQIVTGRCEAVVTTLAGAAATGNTDGIGSAARFNYPYGVAVDASGTVYVADGNNHRIRKITPAGAVTTLAGSTSGFTDGTGSAARFYNPVGVTVGSGGVVYVGDAYNNRIRSVSPAGVVTTLAGSSAGYVDATGTAARFYNPYGVAVDASGNVYVADVSNHRIRKITSGGVVTTFAGSTAGYTDATGTAAQFNNPYGVAVDSSGNVYVADVTNHRIRKITPAGAVTTLAGSTQGYADGIGAAAQFNNPYDVAVDAGGNVYVADRNNNRIRKVSPSGTVSTLAGTGVIGFADGPGLSAQFYAPYSVAVDGAGIVYVADTYNQRIRKIEQ